MAGERDSQHNEAGEVGEGVVWYDGDAVQRQRQSLKVGLVPQRADGDLRQVVVVQPQVAQLLEALEAVVRNCRDVVGVQAAARQDKCVREVKKNKVESSSSLMNLKSCLLIYFWRI